MSKKKLSPTPSIGIQEALDLATSNHEFLEEKFEKNIEDKEDFSAIDYWIGVSDALRAVLSGNLSILQTDLRAEYEAEKKP